MCLIMCVIGVELPCLLTLELPTLVVGPGLQTERILVALGFPHHQCVLGGRYARWSMLGLWPSYVINIMITYFQAQVQTTTETGSAQGWRLCARPSVWRHWRLCGY